MVLFLVKKILKIKAKKEYTLSIKKSVRKELLNLQPKFFKQVMSKILELAENPEPQDRKILKGSENYYRVDQGEFRIIYLIENTKIKIIRVGKRNDDEVYQNL
jgi:mRNA interferase RelE/StbE